MSTVLVTGASGFVGSHVSRVARSAGAGVRTTARRAGEGIDSVADLCDRAAVARIPLHDVTGVIHCAGAVPARSTAFAHDNVDATRVLVEALERAPSVRRIVNVSSMMVYQRPQCGHWRVSEESPVVDTGQAEMTYGCSKRAAELTLDALSSRRPGVQVMHLRVPPIYGRGMLATALLSVLVARALRNEPLVLHGPRGFTQNYVHVDDVAELSLALADESAARPPGIVNVCSDDTYRLFELAELVRVALGSESRIVDQTEDVAVATPQFINSRAKLLHPRFRCLQDHLQDLA